MVVLVVSRISKKKGVMDQKRCAIFSCLGLGDGLIALTLSNNLFQNGLQTMTFHPFLHSLQDWFPYLPMQGFPHKERLLLELEGYHRFYIFFEKSQRMQQVIDFCNTNFPDRTLIINPIATKNTDYMYWENARFNGALPFVDNIQNFCRDIVKLCSITKENGIQATPSFMQNRFPKRIVIHPTSSRQGKNWPKEKFIKVAEKLKKKGFDPCFILTQEERKDWPCTNFPTPDLVDLRDLAGFICESGWMIGNDSGIGHLASCLGLRTLIISRSSKTSCFWRPSWSPGSVVHPSNLIPNIKGLRWRDRHWKTWISISKVVRAFGLLVNAH